MSEDYLFSCIDGYLVPSERQLERACRRRLADVLKQLLPKWKVDYLSSIKFDDERVSGCTVTVKPCYGSPSPGSWDPSTHEEIESTFRNYLQSLTDGDGQAHVDITLEIKFSRATVSVRMLMPVADWSEATLSRMLIPIKDQITYLSQTEEALPKGTLSLRCESTLSGPGL